MLPFFAVSEKNNRGETGKKAGEAAKTSAVFLDRKVRGLFHI